jgi:hypothetical protein
VRVLQARRDPDLAEKTLGTEKVGQVRVQQLERNRPVVFQVPGIKDGGHSATTKLPLDAVAVGQCRLQTDEVRAQREFLGGGGEKDSSTE